MAVVLQEFSGSPLLMLSFKCTAPFLVLDEPSHHHQDQNFPRKETFLGELNVPRKNLQDLGLEY